MARIVVLILVLFYNLSVFSQEEDFRTWWAVQAGGELFNTVDFKVTPELRLYENSSRISSSLLDLEASYRLNKYFRFGGQYRFEQEGSDEKYLANRLGGFVKARYKIKRFRFGYRGLYCWEYKGVNTTEAGNVADQFHRHRLSLAYYRKKWDLKPSVSYEQFLYVNEYEYPNKSKYRFSFALDYELTKKVSLAVSYKIQEELNINNPAKVYILATKLAYQF